MKITVSIPDDLYSAAETVAENKGLNRSQFYAQALMCYLATQQQTLAREVGEINAALDALAADPAYAEEQAALAAFHRLAVRSALPHLDDAATVPAAW